MSEHNDSTNVNPTDPDATPIKDSDAAMKAYNASLEEEIQKVKLAHAALQQEFNIVDDETAPEQVRKALIASVPRAVQQIIFLAEHADSESVRSANSKYIIDVALGKGLPADPQEKAYEALLRELTAKPSKEGPAVDAVVENLLKKPTLHEGEL